MTGIASVGQLVAVIQAQLARSRRAQPGKAAPRAAAQARPGDLEGLIAQRVGLIDPDDPERGRKAFRAFLEAVLLAQLGEQLLNDPAFHVMVGDIQQVMEGDAQCAPLVAEAISHLLSQTGVKK